MRAWTLILACSLAAPCLAANKLACYEEPGTRKTMCFDEARLTSNGSVRAAPLYMGGPKGVEKTSFTIITDCAKGISTLQDQKGINFAGGASNQTRAMRSLSTWMCEAKSPKADPKLRQF